MKSRDRFATIQTIPTKNEKGEWWFEGRQVYLISHPEWKKEFLERHKGNRHERI